MGMSRTRKIGGKNRSLTDSYFAMIGRRPNAGEDDDGLVASLVLVDRVDFHAGVQRMLRNDGALLDHVVTQQTSQEVHLCTERRDDAHIF